MAYWCWNWFQSPGRDHSPLEPEHAKPDWGWCREMRQRQKHMKERTLKGQALGNPRHQLDALKKSMESWDEDEMSDSQEEWPPWHVEVKKKATTRKQPIKVHNRRTYAEWNPDLLACQHESQPLTQRAFLNTLQEEWSPSHTKIKQKPATWKQQMKSHKQMMCDNMRNAFQKRPFDNAIQEAWFQFHIDAEEKAEARKRQMKFHSQNTYDTRNTDFMVYQHKKKALQQRPFDNTMQEEWFPLHMEIEEKAAARKRQMILQSQKTYDMRNTDFMEYQHKKNALQQRPFDNTMPEEWFLLQIEIEEKAAARKRQMKLHSQKMYNKWHTDLLAYKQEMKAMNQSASDNTIDPVQVAKWIRKRDDMKYNLSTSASCKQRTSKY